MRHSGRVSQSVTLEVFIGECREQDVGKVRVKVERQSARALFLCSIKGKFLCWLKVLRFLADECVHVNSSQHGVEVF